MYQSQCTRANECDKGNFHHVTGHRYHSWSMAYTVLGSARCTFSSKWVIDDLNADRWLTSKTLIPLILCRLALMVSMSDAETICILIKTNIPHLNHLNHVGISCRHPSAIVSSLHKIPSQCIVTLVFNINIFMTLAHSILPHVKSWGLSHHTLHTNTLEALWPL